MSELKRCPFCGGEADVHSRCNYVETANEVMYFVRCNRCKTESAWFYKKEKAVEAWNTRKPMDRIVERLKKELLESLNKANDEMIDNGHTLDFEHYFGEKESYEKAIEIVKEEGGLNEKV